MKLCLSIAVVFALCAFAVESLPTGPHNLVKLNCIIKHLQKFELLEKDYPMFDGDDSVDCSPLIEEVTQLSFNSVIEGLKSEGLEMQEKCVLDNLKTNKWPENNMKHALFDASTTVDDEAKSMKLAGLIKTNTDILLNAMGMCKSL